MLRGAFMHDIDRMVYQMWRPIEQAPADIRRAGREVARRTGTSAWYNARAGQIMWCYGDTPHGGPLGVEARGYPSHEIDRMVEYIQLGKIGRRAKNRIATARDISEANDARQRQGKSLADRRPGALDYAAFLDRRRRGTGTLVSV